MDRKTKAIILAFSILFLISIVQWFFLFNWNKICRTNEATYKESIEKLKTDWKLILEENKNLIIQNNDLLYYKDVITLIEKEKLAEMKSKLEESKKSSILNLFNEDWTLIDKVNWYKELNAILKKTDFKINFDYKFDFSYKAPSVKETKILIDLSENWTFEKLQSINLEWFNIVNFSITKWNTNFREYDPVNHILSTFVNNLDDNSRKRLFHDIAKNRDIMKSLTMIHTKYQEWKWFNFLKTHDLWIKLLYSYAKRQWISKKEFTLMLIEELQTFPVIDINEIFVK